MLKVLKLPLLFTTKVDLEMDLSVLIYESLSSLGTFNRRNLLSRHGVVAAASPRMAAHNALEGEPAPFERAIFLDGFHRILRAGGTVAAGRRRPRRYKVAIDPYQGQHHRLQRLGQIMENTFHSPTSFISRWRSLCILDVAMSHTGNSSPI